MALTVLEPSEPVSSGEMPTIDFDRIDVVNQRHDLLTEYMQLKDHCGLLLRDPANFSWLSAGGDNTHRGGSEPVAAVLVTPEARVVLCNNVDSGQIFDRELAGLGFLLKERPWTEAQDVLQSDCCRGRRLGCDVHFPNTDHVADELSDLRQQLAPRDKVAIRKLGREVAHAVEATCRNFEHGSTEADVAGHLAHRLMKHCIEPVRIQVMADGQGWRYRHWGYSSDRIERNCVVSCTGRRNGLHVSASRTVSMGQPTDELQETHHLATLIQATGLFFTQAGWSAEETWKRVDRIYEKFGVPDEWRLADQAELTGYKIQERRVLPSGLETFQVDNAVHWHPSVRASMVSDTILVHQEGYELLTPTQNWPVLTILVKGKSSERPGILIREE